MRGKELADHSPCHVAGGGDQTRCATWRGVGGGVTGAENSFLKTKKGRDAFSFQLLGVCLSLKSVFVSTRRRTTP